MIKLSVKMKDNAPIFAGSDLTGAGVDIQGYTISRNGIFQARGRFNVKEKDSTGKEVFKAKDIVLEYIIKEELEYLALDGKFVFPINEL